MLYGFGRSEGRTWLTHKSWHRDIKGSTNTWKGQGGDRAALSYSGPEGCKKIWGLCVEPRRYSGTNVCFPLVPMGGGVASIILVLPYMNLGPKLGHKEWNIHWDILTINICVYSIMQVEINGFRWQRKVESPPISSKILCSQFISVFILHSSVESRRGLIVLDIFSHPKIICQCRH